MTSNRTLRRQAGFTLLEALIALLITAFGMLGLAGMQMMMSRNADVAKQRSEATRLAEQQIETMRGYTQIQSATGVFAWNDLAGSTQTVTPTGSNTAYTVTSELSGTISDTMRVLKVTVSWRDRSNELNDLKLNTVIAQLDPARSGGLGFPLPANTNLRRPMDRSLNIPFPARDIGNGTSVYSLSNFAIVFSNDSGYVVKRCDAVDIDDVESEEDLDNCSDFNAYIVAGYVSKTMSSFPASLDINETDMAARLTGDESGIECSMQTAENQNTGATISDYKYYLCVIPVATEGTWSGRIHLSGMNSGTDYLVCRFQYADTDYIDDNQRNLQPYSGVNQSLDNQNYVITTSNNCPTVSGLATVEHQNCRSSNPNANAARATDCPAS
jgi:Tfp pilus assembly protein PilV